MSQGSDHGRNTEAERYMSTGIQQAGAAICRDVRSPYRGADGLSSGSLLTPAQQMDLDNRRPELAKLAPSQKGLRVESKEDIIELQELWDQRNESDAVLKDFDRRVEFKEFMSKMLNEQAEQGGDQPYLGVLATLDVNAEAQLERDIFGTPQPSPSPTMGADNTLETQPEVNHDGSVETEHGTAVHEETHPHVQVQIDNTAQESQHGHDNIIVNPVTGHKQYEHIELEERYRRDLAESPQQHGYDIEHAHGYQPCEFEENNPRDLQEGNPGIFEEVIHALEENHPRDLEEGNQQCGPTHTSQHDDAPAPPAMGVFPAAPAPANPAFAAPFEKIMFTY